MPIVFYLVLIFIAAVSIRFNKESTILDKQSTDSFKGIFVLLIIFSHILNRFIYTGFGAELLLSFRSILGQLVVSIFFMFSGYGLFFQISRKGVAYSKTIITNRVLRILIYSVVSLVPFFVLDACTGVSHNWYDYPLSIVGVRSFGNPEWFILAILCCYFVSWFSFLFKFKKPIFNILIVLTGIIVYIVFMIVFHQKERMYDTIICFPIGMFSAIIAPYFSKIKKWICFFASLVCAGAVVLFSLLHIPYLVKMPFENLFFCLFFLFFTKVFIIKSFVLSFFGKNSFAFFFIHMIPILCFVRVGTISNEHLNYLILFSSSILVGVPYIFIYKFLDHFIIDKIVNRHREFVMHKLKYNSEDN